MKEKLIKNWDGSQGRIIQLDTEEVKTLCRPGELAGTCVWLVCGGEGFECLYFNRRAVSLTGEILEDRWRAGLTVAKRDGCSEIRIKEFHGHLDVCSQCEHQPFNLCPEGAGLLKAAARGEGRSQGGRLL